MKSIGGFFELELNPGEEYHSEALALNLGRMAFRYILSAYDVKRLFIPRYICGTLINVLNKLDIEMIFYNIDENLEPVYDFAAWRDDDWLLYVNYFGLKDTFICRLHNVVKHLIIDNVQAFFSTPVADVPTFYSARKWFGVPDGAYLYTTLRRENPLSEYVTPNYHFNHLIDRLVTDGGNPLALTKYRIAECDLDAVGEPREMSRVTRRLLQNIDYERVILERRVNFACLHEHLFQYNRLSMPYGYTHVPMVYPLWLQDAGGLRECLTKNKIFTARYWPDMPLGVVDPSNLERDLYNNLIPLPVDQRYTVEDMKRVLEIINAYGKNNW